MYTRCPKCESVHSVTAQMLSKARGLVQCGQCGKAFNALNFLFDQWLSDQPQSPATETDIGPPVIGMVSTTTEDGKKTKAEETDATGLNPDRLAWGLMTALLVLVTIANIGWTFREPLMQNPAVNSWLKYNNWLQVESEGLLKDPSQIRLVSRDMHSHPTRTGILVLSLTFVNLAQRPQIFPILKITLLDISNQPIAQRRFQPADYLRPGANTKSGLAADVFLPVLLELGDPGEQAVGFEIQFL
jgi:predicted Zn finger-like uncharacterized protein